MKLLFSVLQFIFFWLLATAACEAREIRIDDEVDGIAAFADTNTLEAAVSNKLAINHALQHAEAGDTIVFPKGTFYAIGGIYGSQLHNVTIRLEGRLSAYGDFDAWPLRADGVFRYQDFFKLSDSHHINIIGAGAASSPAHAAQHSTASVIDGQGKAWWDKWIFDPLKGKSIPHRPNLVCLELCTDVYMHGFTLLNSMAFHVIMPDVARVEIANVNVFVDRAQKEASKRQGRVLLDYLQVLRDIDLADDDDDDDGDGDGGEDGENRRAGSQGNGRQEIQIRLEEEFRAEGDSRFLQLFELSKKLSSEGWSSGFDFNILDVLTTVIQLQDLNTDGFDPSGRDIWIHDCIVVNDDDSIAVKPMNGRGVNSKCSENMLFENLSLTGVGASIGSVPPHVHHNCVRNITFRNITMPGTAKGVYIKSNPSCDASLNKTGEIRDIVYEDIDIRNSIWWPIWIGPQQQQEPGTWGKATDKCPLLWPLTTTPCHTQECVTFNNISLRRITITDPLFSPGVVYGNKHSVITNLHMEDVNVKFTSWLSPYGRFPYNREILCKHTTGTSLRSNIAPTCLKKLD